MDAFKKAIEADIPDPDESLQTWLTSHELNPSNDPLAMETAAEYAIDVLTSLGYTPDDVDELGCEIGDHLHTVLMMLYVRSPQIAIRLASADTLDSHFLHRMPVEKMEDILAPNMVNAMSAYGQVRGASARGAWGR